MRHLKKQAIPSHTVALRPSPDIAELLRRNEELWALWLLCRALPKHEELDVRSAMESTVKVDEKLALTCKLSNVYVKMEVWDYYVADFLRDTRESFSIETVTLEARVYKNGHWKPVPLDDVRSRINAAIVAATLGKLAKT